MRRSLVSLAVLGLSLAAVPGFAQSSPNPFQFSTPVIAHGPFLLSEVYPVLPLGYGIPSPGVSGVNLYSLVVAVLGAIVVLVVFHTVRRAI